MAVDAVSSCDFERPVTLTVELDLDLNLNLNLNDVD